MKLLEIYQFFLEGDYDAFDNDSGAAFWGNYGAGVLPIDTTTGMILVGLRSQYVNEPGTWGVFGGKVDDEEGMDVKDEAKREFMEETGYGGSIKLHPAYIFKTGDDSFTYYNFIGEIDRQFNPKKNWETSDFKWLSFEELMDLSPKHFGLESLLNDNKSLSIIKELCGIK